MLWIASGDTLNKELADLFEKHRLTLFWEEDSIAAQYAFVNSPETLHQPWGDAVFVGGFRDGEETIARPEHTRFEHSSTDELIAFFTERAAPNHPHHREKLDYDTLLEWLRNKPPHPHTVYIRKDAKTFILA